MKHLTVHTSDGQSYTVHQIAAATGLTRAGVWARVDRGWTDDDMLRPKGYRPLRRGIDLVGQRFGRLIVTKRAPRETFGSEDCAQWWCRCDCGEEVIVSSRNLRGGYTRSCGCLRRERAREVGYANRKKE